MKLYMKYVLRHMKLYISLWYEYNPNIQVYSVLLFALYPLYKVIFRVHDTDGPSFVIFGSCNSKALIIFIPLIKRLWPYHRIQQWHTTNHQARIHPSRTGMPWACGCWTRTETNRSRARYKGIKIPRIPWYYSMKTRHFDIHVLIINRSKVSIRQTLIRLPACFNFLA